MRSSVFQCTLGVFLFGAFLLADASAQTSAVGVAPPVADSGRRLALVIGNETYPSSRLKNPGNDARAIKSALTEAGFQADMVTDVTFKEMSAAIDGFIARIHTGDVALFFYSGHGIQIEGENYLLPVDFAPRDEADARYQSYSASRILDRMTGTGARMKVLVLDACRSNPFRVSRDLSGGLAAMASAGRGSLIAFAAGPGGTADDNPSGANGLFTLELLKAMREPGLGIEQVFARVRSAVDQASQGRQTPWTNSSLIGDFYFHAPSARPATASAPVPPAPAAAPVRPAPPGVPVPTAPVSAASSSTAIPRSALAIVRGNELTKSFNWSATSIDLKAPGAEVAARREIGLAVRRALSMIAIPVALYSETGVYWSDPSVDLTNYVAQSWQAGAAQTAAPPSSLPGARIAYVDVQKVVDGSNLGNALKVQVQAGGSTAAAVQAGTGQFQQALMPVVDLVARARGVQLLFTGDSGLGLAYADEKLDVTADVILALNQAGLGQSPGPSPVQLAPDTIRRVRWVNLQQIVSRSRLGRAYTEELRQAMAGKQEDPGKLSATLQENLLRALAPIVERDALAAGIRVILNASAESGLVWGDKGLDYTDTLIEHLDAATPASVGASLPPLPPSPVRVGGNIKAPNQIKSVPPVYPAIAQMARVQGVVTLEATIGPDGRVQDATVQSSIPLLDQAAIDAVKQWEFAPTLLNGIPVPVIMTVTVTFSLR